MKRRGTEKCTNNERCISESIYRRSRRDTSRYPGRLLFDPPTFSCEPRADGVATPSRHRDLACRPRSFNIRLPI